ncbi:MAG TPA: anaerobic ribonucleoside-triphosphate reductase [Nitrososphaera sp.]|nr:anaerobic ribonucleoside-triphosphate reductase [Nitrososphaera sp.]
MEPSFDYSQKESRKGGVLESASKRVRMIFSVMASPNRIDILRILNTKGPLTYSELKALAGFKSKKESGKFAYHLRKLLRQLLVALNKGERRYTITNLGKLVLSLARQIEERSIIESGKMYVRTSRQTIEEFNSHKIIQSLVREANLSLEQAHKITEEVENKIYKFQTAYLTSSLIRETVNSVLIEHGHEEYRNKLARLGLPSSDISEMLTSEDATRSGAAGVMARAAGSVFSEYLIFNTLPKDIADMHLAGEIHIAQPGVWGLLPDTLFVDLSSMGGGGGGGDGGNGSSLDLGGRYPAVARLASIKTADDILAALPVLIALLSREASTEVVLEGLAPALARAKDAIDNDHLAAKFARALVSSSAAAAAAGMGLQQQQQQHMPVATLVVPLGDAAATIADAKQLNALLDGYRRYVDATPVPRIGLAITTTSSSSTTSTSSSSSISRLKDSLDHITAAVRSGGIITIGGNGRSSSGLRKTVHAAGSGKDSPSSSSASTAAMSFQALSINLPRLAYESNRDETYFRAKLALAIKPSLAAMAMRKKAVMDGAKRGLLPAFSAATQSMQRATSSIVINLTGLRESVFSILGHDEANSGAEIVQKVIKTAVEVAAAQGKQLGEDSCGVSMIIDDSATRFATLDSEKYGKVSLLQSQNTASYSQGMTLGGRQQQQLDRQLAAECTSIDRILNGGLAATVDVTDLGAGEARSAIEAAATELASFRPRAWLAVCATCGKKYRASADRCESCKSQHRLPLISA